MFIVVPNSKLCVPSGGRFVLTLCTHFLSYIPRSWFVFKSCVIKSIIVFPLELLQQYSLFVP